MGTIFRPRSAGPIGGLRSNRKGMRTAMTYKDILVHLTEDPRNVARTDAALDLARRFGAHLTALYTLPPPQQLYYIGAYIPAELFQRQIDDAKKKAARARRAFEATSGKHGVPMIWVHGEIGRETWSEEGCQSR